MRAALFTIVLAICGNGLNCQYDYGYQYGGNPYCSSQWDCVQYGVQIKNTMCTYPGMPSYSCQNLVDAQTEPSRQAMLQLHNDFRNKLAGGEIPGWPQAANMMEMSWDNGVEAVAHRWAIQCQNGHDQCRRTPRYGYVGQNIGMSFSSRVDVNDAIKSHFENWVNEKRHISYPEAMVNSYQFAKKWGHFTQVIWAKSSTLGCSTVHYERDNWIETVIVCNYGPGGNMERSPMYQQGAPASNCPEGTSRSVRYPNLCASPNQ